MTNCMNCKHMKIEVGETKDQNKCFCTRNPPTILSIPRSNPITQTMDVQMVAMYPPVHHGSFSCGEFAPRMS